MAPNSKVESLVALSFDDTWKTNHKIFRWFMKRSAIFVALHFVFHSKWCHNKQRINQNRGTDKQQPQQVDMKVLLHAGYATLALLGHLSMIAAFRPLALVTRSATTTTTTQARPDHFHAVTYEQPRNVGPVTARHSSRLYSLESLVEDAISPGRKTPRTIFVGGKGGGTYWSTRMQAP